MVQRRGCCGIEGGGEGLACICRSARTATRTRSNGGSLPWSHSRTGTALFPHLCVLLDQQRSARRRSGRPFGYAASMAVWVARLRSRFIAEAAGNCAPLPGHVVVQGQHGKPCHAGVHGALRQQPGIARVDAERGHADRFDDAPSARPRQVQGTRGGPCPCAFPLLSGSGLARSLSPGVSVATRADPWWNMTR